MKKTKIEWCDSTWNPVTGCLHGCEYCYARRIAERFADKNNLTYVDGVKPSHLKNIPYPYGFFPTLHPDRLDEPARMTKPRNIFVCSMADLFGGWVPDEWIQEVFSACEKAPQHNYLFLTKNPARYRNAFLYECMTKFNAWIGTTIAYKEDKSRILEFVGNVPLYEDKNPRRFISIEPILADIGIIPCLYMLDWVIIGAETGNRKGKVIPQKEWIDKIVSQCKAYGIPVFMKNSLTEIMGDEFRQEYPNVMKNNA